jgi:hypothetical protein
LEVPASFVLFKPIVVNYLDIEAESDMKNKLNTCLVFLLAMMLTACISAADKEAKEAIEK